MKQARRILSALLVLVVVLTMILPTTTYAATTPSITSQPTNQTVNVGGTATFAVKASGTNLKYQWQWRPNNTAAWQAAGAAGNKTATLSVPGTADRNGYQYRCEVTDGLGNKVYSNVVTLTVKASAITITSQPTNQTVNVGGTAVFKVTATGTELKYQWQWRPNNSAAWQAAGASGNKTATLSVPGTADRNGYQYRCQITDSLGNVVHTNAVTLTVKAAGITITSQPTNQTVAVGGTAVFKVTATGTELKYQWQWRPNSSAAWQAAGASGNKTATLSVPGTADRNGYQYRCQITDSLGNKANTNAVTLTVGAAGPVINTQPKNVNVLPGGTATFTVKATGTNLKYQWQYRTSATGAWTNNSCTTATFTISQPGAWRDGYQYRCKVTDSKGSVFTDVVTLRVLSISQQPANVAVDADGTATFTVKATGANLKYQWQYRTSATGTWTNNTCTTATFTIKQPGEWRNGYQYRCVVTDASGNKVTSVAATLTVRTAVKDTVMITGNPVNQAVVEGATATFRVAATGSGAMSYQWEWRASDTAAWANASAEGNKTATLTVPATMSRNGYQYRCKVTSGNATTYSNAATLTVSPAVTITAQPENQTIPASSGVYFTVAAESNGEIVYQWQFRRNNAAAWADITAETSESVSFSNYDTANLWAYADTEAGTGYQVRCKITVNGITQYSNAATLTVYGKLSVSPSPTEFDDTEHLYIQLGEEFTVEFAVSGGLQPLTFTWYQNGKLVDLDNSNRITLTLTEDMLASGQRYVRFQCDVTDANGATARSKIYQVNVYDPIQITAQPENMVIQLPKDKYDFVVQQFYVSITGGNPEFITYQWQYSLDKNTWHDVSVAETQSGNPNQFVVPQSYEQYLGKTQNMDVSAVLGIGSNIKNNGGVWVRCVIADTMTGDTVISDAAAYNYPMSVTASKSGSYCYITVSGGMGTKTYKWYGLQGNYYYLSDGSSIKLEPNRFEDYELTITDSIIGKITVHIDPETGAIIE